MIFELRLVLSNIYYLISIYPSIICSDIYLRGVSPDVDIAHVIQGWLCTWALLSKLRPF
jgi:hypothetical protein